MAIHTINGKSYLRVKDKLLEIDHFDTRGKPVIKTTSIEKANAAGGTDITICVECLQISGAANPS